MMTSTPRIPYEVIIELECAEPNVTTFVPSAAKVTIPSFCVRSSIAMNN